MSTGIYKITNLINNKAYIGQSVNIERRWADEKRRAFQQNEEEYNAPRSRAFRKYGLENFKFEILEECDIQDLNQKESYYIQHYNTIIPKGYNVTAGGQQTSSIKLTLPLVEEISDLLSNTNYTNKEIGKLYNISENTVCGINTGYYWKRENIDYPIRKKKTQEKNIVSKSSIRPNTRKVVRPDKDTLLKEIATSSFSAVGKKYGVSDKAIVKWCQNYNLPTHKKDLVELYKNQ